MKEIPIQTCDVAIIGSGPAGLSAAITLVQSGMNNVIVIERELEAGGIPRHCGHIAFGFMKHKRILTGPQYAAKNLMLAKQLGIEIRVNTTVTRLGENGVLDILSAQGVYQLKSKRVLIATGTRETPRAARLVTGDRAIGIYNTGALQGMVYLKKVIPFKRPLIVGTEIVSFSALLTCKQGGIKPVAMIEEQDRPSVRWPIHYGAALFGTPLLLNTKIHRIVGDKRVVSVILENMQGEQRRLDCDGILFTGQFTPESSLIQMSHLDFDTSNFSPMVEESGRCSDPTYYAAGNVCQMSPEAGRNRWFYVAGRAPNAVNISGRCWDQGEQVAHHILNDLGI